MGTPIRGGAAAISTGVEHAVKPLRNPRVALSYHSAQGG